MPRIRSLHPTQWTDEEFVACTPLARLLALGLRNEADDQGVFEWKPVTLKMRLMPVDNVDMEELLEELETTKQIRRFQSGGKNYGAIRNFRLFQRPKSPNAMHPLPDELRKYVGLDADDSGNEAQITTRTVPKSDVEKPEDFGNDKTSQATVSETHGDDEASIPRKEEMFSADGGWREGGRGGGKDSSANASESISVIDDEFEAWWKLVPRKLGKGQARKAYRAARKKVDAETLAAGIKRYAASTAESEPQFVKHPSTWLNGECWLDEDARPPPGQNGSGDDDDPYIVADMRRSDLITALQLEAAGHPHNVTAARIARQRGMSVAGGDGRNQDAGQGGGGSQ